MRPARILVATFGSRGDVRPHILLVRALAARGHAPTLLTNPEYAKYCRDQGVRPELAESPLAPLRQGRPRAALRAVAALIARTHELTREADLVVHNAFAYFAGEFARQGGKPALHVALQPLLPSRARTLSLLGGQPAPAPLARLSHAAPRLVPLLLAPALRRAARATGVPLSPWANPLTAGLPHAPQILAYSPTLAPGPDADPGTAPGEGPAPAATGAWFDPGPPPPLAPETLRFLAAGPPPVYVGFGSMFWRGAANTELVLEALRQAGLRAVLGTAGGALAPGTALPPGIHALGYTPHAALFPRVAAVAHHGGSGTTHEGLRHGRPTAVFPVLGDQAFWGRQVARLGAGDAPTPLRRTTPALMAARLRALVDTPAYAAAAGAVAARIAGEPGLGEAVEVIEGCWKEKAGGESISP